MVDDPTPPPTTIEDPPAVRRFARRLRRKVSQRTGAMRQRARTFTIGAAAARTGQFILCPPKMEKFCVGCTRVGQWTALVLLPFVIIISLAFVEALSDVFTSLFTGTSNDIATSDGITAMGFIVTLMNLLLFIVAAWFWFLWVRTAGFKLFDIGAKV